MNTIRKDYSSVDDNLILNEFEALSKDLSDDNNRIFIGLENTFFSKELLEALSLFLTINKHRLEGVVIVGADRPVKRLLLKTLPYPLYLAQSWEEGELWFEENQEW